MSSPSNPQHEPTMEEILASIRKIISEDQTEPAKPEAPAPAPVAAAPAPKPVAAPEPEEPEVLELTHEIVDEKPVFAAPEPEPMPVDVSNDIVFETIEEPVAAPKASHAPVNADDLISPATHQAVSRALDAFDSAPKEEPSRSAAPAFNTPTGHDVESVFTRAVQEAFGPLLHDWVDANQDGLLTNLKPLIREWMDENLPSLIEDAVANELRSRRKR